MEEDVTEKTRYLKILTELQLYPRIKILNEMTNNDKEEDLSVRREKLIENFIEDLPEYLKEIDNYKEIVLEALVKVEKNVKEIKEKSEKDREDYDER